ncbi:MAG TPA: EamA family transporter [Jiangellales bacterium]|nr:EamA family transporter [Jiangellales bacterium]
MSAPPTRLVARPGPADLALLGVAVVGVSASAPIIVAAAAPALAIALWRNVLGSVVLLPWSLVRSPGEIRRLTGRERRLVLAAGLALAAHFATWVPSVTLTTVASAVALGSTAPVWNALIARAQGQAVPGRAWAGISLSLLGVLLLTGIDVTVSRQALLGDLLALAGGFFAAVYVALGGEVRRTVSTGTYSALCYLVCSAVLLPVCLVAGAALGGYDARTWVLLVALTVTAQLLGHTLFNAVVGRVGPLVVALAVLLEAPGAAVIAALWLGQVPPAAALPAALLVVLGVALVVTARAPEAAEPAA